MNPPPRSWSIYSRTEITEHYKIFERIGSGAYADVYRASRLSDGLIVALKEIHDYQSAFREIEALQILQNSPNIVSLYEYFWRDDEDAVLVLEYLRTDLSSVVREAKKNWENGLTAGEIKRWIIQILLGVDACHRNSIVHRDLKPANLLISDDGVLKLADFGQARILLEPRYVGEDTTLHAENTPSQMWTIQQPDVVSGMDKSSAEKSDEQDQTNVGKEEYLQQLNDFKVKDSLDEIDKDTNFQDGDASCLATCTTSDLEDDTLKSSYSYEVEGEGEEGLGPLTSCVGSRWFKAPELLYGSTNYGKEIDLWSLGCIFAELLNLEPLFPGVSDIDQISRINNVLGNLSEETWPGCLKLPDYGKICFGKIEKPLGLESCLPNRSSAEVELIRKLVCYDPASRATAMELLQDSYFHEEPLPLPENQLRVPCSNSEQDGFDYKDMSSDSDFDEFQGNGFDVSNTANGFSIRFP